MPIQADLKGAAARDVRIKERRQGGRRAHDKRRAAIEALGQWMGGQQSHPLLLLSDTLTLIYWNEPADRAFKRMGWVRQGDRQLEITDPDLAQELAHTLNRWTKPPNAPMRLTSASCTLDVTALQVRQPRSRVFAIEILQTGASSSNIELLRKSFRLTKSEAEVAISIYNGASRASVAAERKVGLETVKTHLARIFKKLKVDSQRGVVRKVSDLLSLGRRIPQAESAVKGRTGL